MEFKVGDRVRLTGAEWEHSEEWLTTGAVVTIERVDGDGELYFVGNPHPWDVRYDGWEVEKEHPNRTYYAGATPPNAEERARVRSLLEEKSESVFEQNVRRILTDVGDIITAKNLAYGDSALNPIRVFSKADRMEQLYIRLDDKLSRVQRGHEYPGDDTLRDIIGYATLILIARESQ